MKNNTHHKNPLINNHLKNNKISSYKTKAITVLHSVIKALSSTVSTNPTSKKSSTPNSPHITINSLLTTINLIFIINTPLSFIISNSKYLLINCMHFPIKIHTNSYATFLNSHIFRKKLSKDKKQPLSQHFLLIRNSTY